MVAVWRMALPSQAVLRCIQVLPSDAKRIEARNISHPETSKSSIYWANPQRTALKKRLKKLQNMCVLRIYSRLLQFTLLASCSIRIQTERLKCRLQPVKKLARP
jgi:hypothetical protein